MLEIKKDYFNVRYIYKFEDLEDSAVTALRKHALNDYVDKYERHYDENILAIKDYYQCDFMNIQKIQRDRYALYTYYPTRPAFQYIFHITNTERWINWLRNLDHITPTKTDLLEFLTQEANN